ncbi:MAG: sugar isomerase domain-containing protein [Armatimonadetes bacterium]|nr:sugar isomerase domain-containing protein [Armatimonadota bacterium]
MLAHEYAQAMRDSVTKIEETQMANIDRAADAIAKALANRGALWLYGIGHGGEQDLTHRAGGFMATKIFSFGVHVSSPIAEALQGRPRPEPMEADLEQIRFAVKISEMRAGDILMLASVSGRNRAPIELTLAWQAQGGIVIAMTSLEYTAQVTSAHPSGKKLCDVADIVIDNCAPFGDACLDVEGYGYKVLPISGAAHIAIGWMIFAETIEKMQALGKPPHIFMSANRPGGMEYNDEAMKEYNKVGY